MKKIIGILGVVVFAATLFVNAKTINNKQEVSLTSLLSLNNANAECVSGQFYNDGRCNLLGNCRPRFENVDCNWLES